MTNSANGIQWQNKIKGLKLRFKYLPAIVSEEGSKLEDLSRIEQATETLIKLKPVWRDKNISLGSKVKLMLLSLVISVFLYACEPWTLTTELKKKARAFGMRCYHLISLISSHSRTMSSMRKFAERSRQPLENMTSS